MLPGLPFAIFSLSHVLGIRREFLRLHESERKKGRDRGWITEYLTR